MIRFIFETIYNDGKYLTYVVDVYPRPPKINLDVMLSKSRLKKRKKSIGKIIGEIEEINNNIYTLKSKKDNSSFSLNYSNNILTAPDGSRFVKSFPVSSTSINKSKGNGS